MALLSGPRRHPPPPLQPSRKMRPLSAMCRPNSPASAGRGMDLPWYRGDDATWTRERWDRAVAELAHAQAAWQHANTLNHFGDLHGRRGSLTPEGGCG